MKISREDLARQALGKALEIRRKLRIPPNYPVDVYEVCDKLNITVQFVDMPSIEGMYLSERNEERILISAYRPLPRKAFTCGHELGHHLFDHGSTLDELGETAENSQFEPQEFLVDCFSGYLLMPKLAVQNAFNQREWSPASATPLQFFTVACSFGVGYDTLIKHMAYSLKMITVAKAKELRKLSPKVIREQLLGDLSTGPLMIIDEKCLLKAINVEVGYQLLLPKTIQVEDSAVNLQTQLKEGNLFSANSQNIARLYSSENDWAAFIKVTNPEYTGFSKFRNLEECHE
ncbi:ImmA/IrrE family metallo-endopeptidase [Leptothoe sp. ISB3NOV94-8A]